MTEQANMNIGFATLVPRMKNGNQIGWAVPGGGYVTDDKAAKDIATTMHGIIKANQRKRPDLRQL